MKQRSVIHSTFVIERTLSAPPERVFAAFSSHEAKARWFVGPDDWQSSDHELDFVIGGRERVSGGPPGGPLHIYESRFEDIVVDERIVTTYEMYADKDRISVSVATLEFVAIEGGTRLTLTEQGAYLDGHDTPASREHGTGDLLDKLEVSLKSSV